MSTSDHNDRPSGGAAPVDPDDTLRNRVVSQEQEEFGGIKWGSAFFGWLTATGMAVLLTALLAAAGAVVGLTTNTDPAEATDAAAQNPDAAGIISAIVLLVVLFVAYYCGGYVAGRMARFSGAKQGLAVWLWALIFAIVLAILGAVLGSRFDVLSSLNTFPRIPVNEGALTIVGIITAIVLALVPLVGAILGGKAGMHYHRKVDRVGLGR
jgi:cytochrome bd-type quinol oxidase subunit 2